MSACSRWPPRFSSIISKALKRRHFNCGLLYSTKTEPSTPSAVLLQHVDLHPSGIALSRRHRKVAMHCSCISQHLACARLRATSIFSRIAESGHILFPPLRHNLTHFISLQEDLSRSRGDSPWWTDELSWLRNSTTAASALAGFRLARADDGATPKRRLLFFTKSSGFEHSAIKRKAPDVLQPRGADRDGAGRKT